MKKRKYYRLVGVLTLVICVCALGSSAWADETSEAYQEMLRLSAEGNQAYEAGQLEEAAGAYSRAYQAYPQPILLKNEMVARYLLEDCERALELGEDFLEAGDTSAEDLADVQAVFGECVLEMAQASESEEDYEAVNRWLSFGEPFFDDSQRDEVEELQGRVEEFERAREEELERDQEVATAPPGETLASADSTLGTKDVAGYSLITVGVGALIIGGIWNVQGLAQYDELEEGVTDRARYDELQSSVSRARRAVPVLCGVGAAAALGGAALLFMPDKDKSVASVSPVVNSRFLGVSLQGRF